MAVHLYVKNLLSGGKLKITSENVFRVVKIQRISYRTPVITMADIKYGDPYVMLENNRLVKIHIIDATDTESALDTVMKMTKSAGKPTPRRLSGASASLQLCDLPLLSEQMQATAEKTKEKPKRSHKRKSELDSQEEGILKRKKQADKTSTATDSGNGMASTLGMGSASEREPAEEQGQHLPRGVHPNSYQGNPRDNDPAAQGISSMPAVQGEQQIQGGDSGNGMAPTLGSASEREPAEEQGQHLPRGVRPNSYQGNPSDNDPAAQGILSMPAVQGEQQIQGGNPVNFGASTSTKPPLLPVCPNPPGEKLEMNQRLDLEELNADTMFDMESIRSLMLKLKCKMERVKGERDALKAVNEQLKVELKTQTQLLKEILNKISELPSGQQDHNSCEGFTPSRLKHLRFAYPLEQNYAHFELPAGEIYVGLGKTIQLSDAIEIETNRDGVVKRGEALFEKVTGQSMGLYSWKGHKNVKGSYTVIPSPVEASIRKILESMAWMPGDDHTFQTVSNFFRQQPGAVRRREQAKTEV